MIMEGLGLRGIPNQWIMADIVKWSRSIFHLCMLSSLRFKSVISIIDSTASLSRIKQLSTFFLPFKFLKRNFWKCVHSILYYSVRRYILNAQGCPLNMFLFKVVFKFHIFLFNGFSRKPGFNK